MQETSLNDFGISDDQYATYQKYKLKVEERNQQIIKFNAKFEKITGLILPLIIFFLINFFLLLNSEGFDNVVLLFESGAYSKIILLIFSLGLVSIPLFFIFRLLWFIPELIIDLLKFDELCKKIYVSNLSVIPRAPYFDVIEEYDRQKQMYEAHKLSLEKEYPGIMLFGYDRGLYFEHLLNKITELEKEYVNKMTLLQNMRIQREYWLSLSGREFEKEIAGIYTKLDYRVQLTPIVGDGGVDIKLWKNGIFSVVQCKNHQHKVPVNVVRDLYGTMNKVGATNGILICSGGFTKGVFDFVKGLPIQLIDLDDLLSKVNKLTPQQIENVSTIFDKKFRDTDSIYEFKIVGELMVLISQFEVCESSPMVNQESTTQKKYCLFETEEEAKGMIQILKGNNTSESNYILEVTEWKNPAKEIITKSRSFFYIRAYRKTHDYLRKEEKFITTDVRSTNRKKRANRYWYTRKYWKRY